MPLAASVSLRDASRSSLNIAARGLIELLFELVDLPGERPLSLAELLYLLATRATGAVEILDVLLDILLFARKRLGLTLGVLDVPAAPRRLRSLELTLGFAKLIDRAGCLRRGGRIAVGRRLAHRVGRLLQLARGLPELRPVLLTREFFELARRFLGLIRERSLRIAAARTLAGRGAPALTLGLLFLSPRQFLQLLGQLVDLLIRLLLRSLAATSRTGSPCDPLRARRDRRALQPSCCRRHRRRRPRCDWR